MDRDDLRSILRNTGVDLWSLINTAVAIAAADHGSELRSRRDGIIEKLYAPIQIEDRNQSNNVLEAATKVRSKDEEAKGSGSPIEKVFGSSPLTPQSNHREEEIEEEEEDNDDLIDQEQRNILAIKDSLEDSDQSDDSVAGLLQNLADLDITFITLKKTDIGRHVNGLRRHPNGLRRHPSVEVLRLVKQLVRKWKEIVDEWVKANSENASPKIITDPDSPQQIPTKNNQNGHQVPEFASSPDPHNVRMSSNRGSSELKAKVIPKGEVPAKPPFSAIPVVNNVQGQKGSLLDGQRLANARKRLQENYEEAKNAKKQRTIQVMDIHETPKLKNSVIARNKGHHQANHC